MTDENECLVNPNICGNGTCINVRGSFECTCNAGYTPGPFQTCEDINECKEMGVGSQCAFRCHNVPGSFRCICPYGYALAPDGRHCQGNKLFRSSLLVKSDSGSCFVTDVDECLTPANNCRYMCKNLIGSFMCICPEGYHKVGLTDECKDIDECSLNSRLCSNGHCVNLEGGYRCECFPGFEISPDGKECIGKYVARLFRERKNLKRGI